VLLLGFALFTGEKSNSAFASHTTSSEDSQQQDTPEAVLARIQTPITQLLDKPQPPLYARHLRSVLALCEDGVFKLQFAGPHTNEQAKELLTYLQTIESGLNDDGGNAEAYLASGRRALTLARLSRSDDTLQFCTVSLPPHWDSARAYPLYVQLHGRGPDLPLAYVNYTFLPHGKDDAPDGDVIVVVPWLRGNGGWRNDNGSEPDIWEAIDDVKSFAKLDADHWYISGHSWGGDDTWVIVQRTPDLWAAAGIMAGNSSGAPLGLGLLSNASHIPFYLWVGDRDPLRRLSFDELNTSLIAVGNPPKLVVATGVGHNYRPQDAAAMQAWLLQHTRHRPSHFSFVVDSTQHRGIWGISIPRKFPDAYNVAEPKAKFECWIERASVRIQTWDAEKLDVDLGPQGLNFSGNVKMIVNGKAKFEGPVPAKAISLSL